MQVEILVDSEEFWGDLEQEITDARHSIFAETMSFEGDAVGEMFSQALQRSRAKDRRLMLDCYIKIIINDKFLYTWKNLTNPELRREVRATRELIRSNRRNGIQVTFTNPFGFLFLRIPLRNHKKLVVIDERITYIGGINFCDHNFDWHDMMLKIESPDVAQFFREDFLADWHGKGAARRQKFDDIEFIVLDGKSNARQFAPVFDLIDAAREKIIIQSPYLTFPFCDALAKAVKRGVRVDILTPGNNNWGIISTYLHDVAATSGFRLHLYQKKMTHLKAMLIDDSRLIVGSSNFDFLSYRGHREILAVISNTETIRQFKSKVLEPDFAASSVWQGTPDKRKARIAKFWMHALDKTAQIISRLPSFY